MNNTVNFDGFSANHVECKIRFNDKNTITRTFEFIVFWCPPQKGMCRKAADVLIKFFNKSGGIVRTVICDPIED